MPDRTISWPQLRRDRRGHWLHAPQSDPMHRERSPGIRAQGRCHRRRLGMRADAAVAPSPSRRRRGCRDRASSAPSPLPGMSKQIARVRLCSAQRRRALPAIAGGGRLPERDDSSRALATGGTRSQIGCRCSSSVPNGGPRLRASRRSRWLPRSPPPLRAAAPLCTQAVENDRAPGGSAGATARNAAIAPTGDLLDPINVSRPDPKPARKRAKRRTNTEPQAAPQEQAPAPAPAPAAAAPAEPAVDDGSAEFLPEVRGSE